MDTTELHERVLYPVTRIRAPGGGGSGVLIYSQPDPRQEGHYINLVLTCEHVIAGAIKTKDEWDSVLKKDVKRDFFAEVSVELFDYEGSQVVSANATQGDVIAYDKHHDIAVVRLHNPRPMPYTAAIIPKVEIPMLRCFDEVWVSGCSLLHSPFASSGELTFLREVIEQETYLMANAPAIFGNSGGGLFYGRTGWLLGLTARVASVELGFGIDIMTWMQFSTHPTRVHNFIEQQELRFLTDPTDDYYTAMARRETKRREAMRNLLLGEGKNQP